MVHPECIAVVAAGVFQLGVAESVTVVGEKHFERVDVSGHAAGRYAVFVRQPLRRQGLSLHGTEEKLHDPV